MIRYGRYAVVALVVVALLSVGAHEASGFDAREYDASNCGSGTIGVEPTDSDDPRNVTDYADLSTDLQAAFDRARSTGGTTSIDPGILSGSPLLYEHDGVKVAWSILVRADGTLYAVNSHTSNCPTVAGTPLWLNYLVDPLVGIYRVFSPLYLPVGGLLGIVLGYRALDGWLRFG